MDLVPDFSESLEEAEAQNCKNDFLKTDYITLMSDTATEDRQFVSDICFELQEINEILQCAQAHVGYRVRDEIIFYMLNNKKRNCLIRILLLTMRLCRRFFREFRKQCIY